MPNAQQTYLRSGMGFDAKTLHQHSKVMRVLFVLLVLLTKAGLSTFANPPMKWENLKVMKAAAEKGDPEAQFLIGLQYKVGDGVSKDANEAARWLRSAAQAGHLEAQTALGSLQAENGDPAEAVKWLRAAAERGSTEAMVNLGAFYADNGGATAGAAESLSWYQKAAERGHAGASRALAEIYARGKGAPADPAQALEWYRKAAELGDNESRFVLGRVEAVTAAVTDDPEKALAWWRAEAKKGDIGAGIALNMIAARARTMAEDPDDTARWSLLLSGLRGAEAYVVRGFMLENGIAVNRDFTAAAACYRRAAELGHAQGEYRLGLMYAEGRGVAKDSGEARKWLDLAAAQGVEERPATADESPGKVTEKKP
jgi:TPR repeat protein